MRRAVIGFALPALGLLLISTGHAADWPQFRHDAGRTAASPEELPKELHLQWVRKLPAPRPAFPGEVRLRFDASYEPVVLGDLMFVPSMVRDTVTALDTNTGEVRWRFFTGGPVRFAPVVWEGKVYATSDDGYLYCIDAYRGTQLWRFRGLPEGQSDRQLLGHGRMISLWPARGGPVLEGGVVYFAAGLWPEDGVFVHALDAASGRPLWSNTTSDRVPRANMDHGIAQYAGITPQGYLAMVGGQLVVPCGAQLPAFLEPATGKLGDYNMGWGGRVGLPKGSWFAAGAGRHLSHSGDLYDITRANDEKFRQPRGADFKSELYAGGFTRLLIDPSNQRELGAFGEPVITEDALYANDAKQGIVARDLSDYELRPRSEIEAAEPRARDQYPDKWQAQLKQLWALPSELDVQIKAGPRLYAAGAGTDGRGTVQAIDIPEPGGEPKTSWQANVDGMPHRLLAAGGRLFVVTKEGAIYAFGAERPDDVTVHEPSDAAAPLADVAGKQANEILDTTSADDGYALLIGVDQPQLAEALLAKSKLLVVAVETDAERRDSIRQRVHESGLYGTRAGVLGDDVTPDALPPLFARLLVCDDVRSLGSNVDAQLIENIVRLLRPYGGQGCLRLAPPQRDEFAKAFANASPPGVSLEDAGPYVLLTREGGLPGAADWSHADGNAANAGASQDTFLKPPLGLLWFNTSLRWHRKVGSAEVRISRGRAVVLADRLYATDVFTGRLLWDRELPPGISSRSQIVAEGDRVFLASRNQCLVLDAADGSDVRSLAPPEGVTGDWSSLRAAGDRLVAVVGSHVVCVDHGSGQPRWKFACSRPAIGLAVGDGKVFCVELVQPRRGETVEKSGTKMRALDLVTGELDWEVPAGADVHYNPEHQLLITTAGVYNAANGERLRAGIAAPQVVGERIVSGTTDSFTVLDVASGEEIGDALSWNRRGCTGLRSACNIVTTRFKANAAYVDLETREITSLWNIRPGCNNNLYPAEGLLNVPNVTGGCECNYTPTSKAFAPAALIRRER